MKGYIIDKVVKTISKFTNKRTTLITKKIVNTLILLKAWFSANIVCWNEKEINQIEKIINICEKSLYKD